MRQGIFFKKSYKYTEARSIKISVLQSKHEEHFEPSEEQ
jgi:hypothetical protein